MSGGDDHVSIGEALPGIRIKPINETDMPVSAIVLAKIINTDTEDTGWVTRGTGDINDQELLGVLIMETDRLRHNLQEAWESDE